MNVLLSAYACAPGKGSDPEIGWNWMQQLARLHDVWVITRTKNRPAIEEGLRREPAPRARFVYLDLPRPMLFWKKWPGGVYLYYYIWQVLAYFKARTLHREAVFARVHHVTFCMYWLPSFMALLPVPFVWGPVGGGESIPASFRTALGWRARIYELLRDSARLYAKFDPAVRMTARRAALALATTPETAACLIALGCKRVRILTCVGVSGEHPLACEERNCRDAERFQMFSAGRLLHWKGFDLALRAIARIQEKGAHFEYNIFGSGPERASLQQLAAELGITSLVHFHDSIPREQLLRRMRDFDALLHPSLHDSGAFACIEAMSAGCAVICLDLGGPALQVTEHTGIKVPAHSPEQAIRDLATAIETLAGNIDLRRRLERGAMERVRAFAWEDKLERLELWARS